MPEKIVMLDEKRSMERASRIMSRNKRLNKWADHDTMVAAAWKAAIGPRLAGRNFGIRVFGKKLVVEVEDQVWKSQLTTLSQTLLQRMADVVGREVVQEIEFRVTRAAAQRIQPRSALVETASLPGLFSDDGDSIQDPILRLNYQQDLRRKKQA